MFFTNQWLPWACILSLVWPHPISSFNRSGWGLPHHHAGLFASRPRRSSMSRPSPRVDHREGILHIFCRKHALQGLPHDPHVDFGFAPVTWALGVSRRIMARSTQKEVKETRPGGGECQKHLKSNRLWSRGPNLGVANVVPLFLHYPVLLLAWQLRLR